MARSDIMIGLIGPQPIISNMLQCIKQYPSFRPIALTFEQDEEAPQLARQLINQVEVILFSSITPFQLAMQEVVFPIPTYYIPLLGTGLYKSLFHLFKKQDPTSLSVDTVTPKDMIQTLKTLDLKELSIHYYEKSVHPTPEELLHFHVQQFNEGRADAVITSNRWVSSQLDALQIPNQWLIPTEQDIIIALARALLSSESRRNKESQIVIGLIHVNHFEKVTQRLSTEHDIQRLNLEIHRILLSYIQSLSGHLIQIGTTEFFFVTTRGAFEWKTNGYSEMPIGREIEKLYHLSLSVGIGFGYNAVEAGTHARLALGHCHDAGGKTCFIVREDKSMIGPIPMTEPLKHDLSLISAELVQTIRSTGLSLTSLNKLIDYITHTGKTEFIAQELSQILGITVRSVHRNLANLLDAKLISITGEDRVRPRGKPNQVYRIQFIEDLIRN